MWQGQPGPGQQPRQGPPSGSASNSSDQGLRRQQSASRSPSPGTNRQPRQPQHSGMINPHHKSRVPSGGDSYNSRGSSLPGAYQMNYGRPSNAAGHHSMGGGNKQNSRRPSSLHNSPGTSRPSSPQISIHQKRKSSHYPNSSNNRWEHTHKDILCMCIITKQMFSKAEPKKSCKRCNKYSSLTISATPVGTLIVSHSKCPIIATTMLDTKDIRHSNITDPKLLEPHYRPCITQIMPRDRYNNNPQLMVAEIHPVNSINSNNLLVPVLTVMKVNWQSVYPHPASLVDYPWVSLKDLTRWQCPNLVSLNAIYISYRYTRWPLS